MFMRDSKDYVVIHCRRTYGARLLYKNRVFYFQTEDGVYRVDLSLSRKGIYRFYNTEKPLVLTESNLARGFFRLAALCTYKETGMVPTQSDWERFLNDAYRYGIMEELK